MSLSEALESLIAKNESLRRRCIDNEAILDNYVKKYVDVPLDDDSDAIVENKVEGIRAKLTIGKNKADLMHGAPDDQDILGYGTGNTDKKLLDAIKSLQTLKKELNIDSPTGGARQAGVLKRKSPPKDFKVVRFGDSEEPSQNSLWENSLKAKSPFQAEENSQVYFKSEAVDMARSIITPAESLGASVHKTVTQKDRISRLQALKETYHNRKSRETSPVVRAEPSVTFNLREKNFSTDEMEEESSHPFKKSAKGESSDPKSSILRESTDHRFSKKSNKPKDEASNSAWNHPYQRSDRWNDTALTYSEGVSEIDNIFNTEPFATDDKDMLLVIPEVENQIEEPSRLDSKIETERIQNRCKELEAYLFGNKVFVATE